MDDRFKAPHSHPRWWYGGDYEPACFNCTHFRGMVKGRVRCTAFPEGIPAELTVKGAIHDRPFQGDSGIRFELYED